MVSRLPRDASGLRKAPLNFRAGSLKAAGRKSGLQHVFGNKGGYPGHIGNLRVQRLKLLDAHLIEWAGFSGLTLELIAHAEGGYGKRHAPVLEHAF
ncbi:hypothetical protein D3C87_1377980 [compost metagenome]